MITITAVCNEPFFFCVCFVFSFVWFSNCSVPTTQTKIITKVEVQSAHCFQTEHHKTYFNNAVGKGSEHHSFSIELKIVFFIFIFFFFAKRCWQKSEYNYTIYKEMVQIKSQLSTYAEHIHFELQMNLFETILKKKSTKKLKIFNE